MIVRHAAPTDAAAIREIYAPYVTDTVISFELEIPSLSEMQRRLQNGKLWLVATDPDVVGYAYASQHRERAAYRWSVDTSVYIHSNAHRRGVGRALYQRLLQMLTEAGYYNAFAGITLPNDASVGLHEAMGFQPIGVYRNVGFKHGAWRDVGWWGRALNQPTSENPAEPTF